MRQQVMRLIGTSSTGTKHDLEIEGGQLESYRLSILGPTGKRHASVRITDAQADELVDYITARKQAQQ